MKTASGDRITVVHIDDDAGFVNLTREALEREHSEFNVITATDPDAGLEQVTDDVDCVVCDYQMPGKDGLEVLEAVHNEYPDLPFILFTGQGSEDVAAEAIQKGVTSYLQKETGTAQFTVLGNRIRTHVEEYRATKRADRLEQEHRLVAEVATDVFFTVDLTTDDISLSKGITEFGYDPNTLDPDHDWWAERIHPDDREWMLAEHEKTLTPTEAGFEEFSGDRGIFANEFRWQGADGTYAHVSATGITLFENSEPVKQIGTMRDITQRKERKQELELLQSLLQQSNDAVYIANANSGEINYVNRTACDQLNYERDELLGTTVPEISKEFTDHDEWISHISDLKATGNIIAEDYHVRSDGTEFPVEVSISYVEIDGDGYVITVGRDISNRKEREQELELLEEVVDHFSDALFVTEAETGIITHVNSATAELLGYDRAALEGAPVYEISTGFEDINDWKQHVDEMRETESKRTESYHQRADGTTVPVEAAISFMETEDTEYLINISRDITERKEHERRLQNQNERLERFVSVVSHDLRSPLNVADGYLDLAQNNGHQEHLEKVESALHRMDRIIDDLLYLARKGDDIGDREPVDLDHLVGDAWEAVKSESVQATLETDATLPTINADPDRLRQVLENLLRNAIEHGGPGVSITVEPVEDGFAVADDGPGIPPDSKSTIFSAGFSTEEDGTGLGLSIVQEIVNAHDWNISVTTSEAGGARFEITGIKKL